MLISPEDLDYTEEQRELIQKVLRGLREIEDGEYIDHAEVKRQLEADLEAEEAGTTK